jgi:hypothetical protein
LQGVWTNATITPLERPSELADHAFFTPEQAVAYERRMNEAFAAEGHTGSGVGTFDETFRIRGKVVSTLRTSLIIDPPNGRIPALTAEGQRREAARIKERSLHGFDGPENRSAWERCLVALSTGPPIMPASYNANYQIVQTAQYFLILSEQIHDARVIPLDGRPHLPPGVRQWMGDSRGHWDGDTLVVETTNFGGQTNFMTFPLSGDREHMKLVERFKRTEAGVIFYEFTVSDPTTFTKPWTAQIPLHKTLEPIFEYACQEGNYGLANELAIARAQEKINSRASEKESR